MTTPGLDALPAAGAVEFEADGRTITLSSLDKVMWPAASVTKGQMLAYYGRIAPVVLPHVAGRALTLGRFPEGVSSYGWYQTNTRSRPAWLPVRPVQVGRGERQHYCVLNDISSLLWAANIGGIELHPFLSRAECLDEPTAVIFDLDPGPPATVVECCRVALLLQDVLAEMDLASFPKTTGSIGLHIHVPLNTPHTFAVTRAFARELARRLSERYPDRIVDVTARSARVGKVLIDWGQNHPHKSLIAPYSLRAMTFPTVATPIAWDEVVRAATEARGDLLAFGPPDVLTRVETAGDLFAPVLELEQRIG